VEVAMPDSAHIFSARRTVADRFFLFCIICFIPLRIFSADYSETEGSLNSADRNRRVVLTTAAGIGAVTVWGVWQWDYFSTMPHAGSEGWFGRNTESGGADKLGHLYSCYIASHGFASLYEHWSFERKDAALFGSLTSLAVFGAMELGDSFSDYGFSGEDMTANLIGCAAGYLLYTCPNLAGKIDLRWEIGLSPNKTDFFTDYENSKYLIVLKLNGFEFAQQNWLKYIELHAGYYTRDFSDSSDDGKRYAYAGVGLNLTDLLFRNGYQKTATLLRYVQPPYTTLGGRHEF
jgi:hypothetical protein